MDRIVKQPVPLVEKNCHVDQSEIQRDNNGQEPPADPLLFAPPVRSHDIPEGTIGKFVAGADILLVHSNFSFIEKSDFLNDVATSKHPRDARDSMPA